MAPNRSDDDIYEVEAVVGKRYRRGKLEYLLKWKGYNEWTWVQHRHCACKKKIARFERARSGSEQSSATASSSSKEPSLDRNGSTSRSSNSTDSLDTLPRSNHLKGPKIWTYEMVEEWMKQEGRDFSRLLNRDDPEMFLGRAIEKIIAHYPKGEKPYFLIQTEVNPTDVATSLTDVVHAVECAVVCRLFPKAFTNYTNFLAYACVMRSDLKRYIRDYMD